MTQVKAPTGLEVKAELNQALTSNYMLVTLKIGRWSANKRDDALAKQVAESKNAVPEAVSATKKLMAGADSELKDVNTTLNAIRTHLYEHSLPWSADTGDKKGPRIVPTKASINLLKELGEMQKAFESAKRRFVKIYASRRDEAVMNLGQLGDKSLYPSEHEVGDLFTVALDMVPVPSVSGFGSMNIPAALAQALGKRMADKQQTIVDGAMATLQERVLETVTNLSDQLHKSADGEGTRLFESLSTNIKPLVGLIDAASLSKDKRLVSLKKELEELAAVDIKKIKKSTPQKKREVAAKADKVVKTLSKKPAAVDVENIESEVLF